jgi:hypothetical protein
VISLALLSVFCLLAVGSVDSNRSSSALRDVKPPGAGNDSERSVGQDVRAMAASLFTSRYSNSAFSSWNVRAAPAGSDCAILLINIGIEMDDSQIQAMQYGEGSYAVYDGGVEHFYHERTFRGVVYKDARGRTWRYGLVSSSEAKHLPHC